MVQLPRRGSEPIARGRWEVWSVNSAPAMVIHFLNCAGSIDGWKVPTEPSNIAARMSSLNTPRPAIELAGSKAMWPSGFVQSTAVSGAVSTTAVVLEVPSVICLKLVP